jgi:TonB family protein
MAVVASRSTRSLGIIMRASWLFAVILLVTLALGGCASPPGGKSASSLGRTPEQTPEYPKALLNSGVSGSVVAWVYVEASGAVTRVEIKQSPHDLISEEVVLKLMKWKYRPEPRAFIGEYHFIFKE